MDALIATTRRELAVLFGSASAWVAMAVFLITVGGLTLGLDDVLVHGQASMRGPLFWMALGVTALAPAVTMRVFAEEARSGALQLWLTMPSGPLALVLGKWLASWALVSVALALTWGWPLGLTLLGPLDYGATAAGYLGLWALSAAVCAVGVAASAATDNQVAAYLMALLVCGSSWVLGLAVPVVPPSWASVVEQLSLLHHADVLATGVLDLRSVVFFAAVTLFAERVALLLLQRRRLA